MYLRLDKALKYLSNDNSLCNNCNREINTKHIILYCTKYEKFRKELYEKLKTTYPIFEHMSPDEKFKLIMNLNIESKQTINIICTFIKQNIM